ncbi:hypothetical protein E7T09_12185 [Deinococcus sp. KSM4-11]|uniref:hypothetical protein n=1 Tax=Deinococcus sp. KSM4-11 TaxID=2568654 RepID=UPI0010A3324C|nr:hypothetical protein [Deinococcus sp. KSM4-11]THF86831.1 hypothetical protein E7T09_12185 [Deinococcus sp. KSM4-11]
MTRPDDKEHTPDWQDTAASLRELFGQKRAAQPTEPDQPESDAAEPALTAFEPGDLPLPVLGEDALPESVDETGDPVSPSPLAGDATTPTAPASDSGGEGTTEPVELPAPAVPAVVAASGPAILPEPSAPPPADAVPAISASRELVPKSVETAPAVSAPASVQAPSVPAASGFSDDLEEEVFAPTAPTSGPVVGDVLDGYHLNEDLGRGWFIASPVASGPSVEVYARPDPLWATLAPHRALPRFSTAGALHVLEPVGGETIKAPVNPDAALAHLTELTRLLFALEKQGNAVVDLEPDSPRVTPGGVRLRFPPRVSRMGEPAEVAVREGFTPPEVLAGQAVDARSGVYLLGALLYSWLTGRTLPAEGTTGAVLDGVSVPGVPQLLRGMLAPVEERMTPAEVLAALKTLTTPTLPAYQVAAATSVGLNPERPMNEDSYGFTWRQLGLHGASTLVLRACVSDGMGGMAAGEVASAAAVDAFLTSGKATLPEMVWDANAAVLTAMAGRDGGCTFSGVEVRGPHLQLGHVGDTRAYVRQAGVVRQLSRDHSYVAAMVASGQMTPEEAQNSPERNKVLRSLGSLRVPQENYVQTLEQPMVMGVGDRVLLVSDGVWGEVPDEVLIPLLTTLPIQPLVDRLIALALEAGAPDNATALVIERVE